MDIFKGIFDITKLPAKFFFLFAVSSGVVLFGPEWLIEKSHLENAIAQHGWIIGLVFVLSAILTLINILIWLFRYFKYQVRFIRAKSDLAKDIQYLSPNEVVVLREFYFQGSTVEMPMDDPVVAGLVEKNIIKMVSIFGGGSVLTSGRYVPMTLTKYASKMIFPSVLGLKAHKEITEQDKAEYMRVRPKWVNLF